MKNVIGIISLLFVAVSGALCFKLLPMPISLLVWIVVDIFVLSSVYRYLRDRYWRKKWLQNPIKADSAEFDKFFWRLSPVNRGWYIHNILEEQDIQIILDRYECRLKVLWNDGNVPLSKKIETSSVFIERIRTLLSALEMQEQKNA